MERNKKYWRVLMKCYTCKKEWIITVPDDLSLWSSRKCVCGGHCTAIAAKSMPPFKVINNDRIRI